MRISEQGSAASLVQQLRHHGRSTGELSANEHASIIIGGIPFLVVAMP